MQINQSSKDLTLKSNHYLLIFVILILTIITAPIEILVSIFLFIIEIGILIDGIVILSHFDKKTGKASVSKNWLFGKHRQEFSLTEVNNLETKTTWNFQIVGPKPSQLILRLKGNLTIPLDFSNYSADSRRECGKAIGEFLGINYS